jgi:hypothetical protein
VTRLAPGGQSLPGESSSAARTRAGGRRTPRCRPEWTWIGSRAGGRSGHCLVFRGVVITQPDSRQGAKAFLESRRRSREPAPEVEAGGALAVSSGGLSSRNRTRARGPRPSWRVVVGRANPRRRSKRTVPWPCLPGGYHHATGLAPGGQGLPGESSSVARTRAGSRSRRCLGRVFRGVIITQPDSRQGAKAFLESRRRSREPAPEVEAGSALAVS